MTADARSRLLHRQKTDTLRRVLHNSWAEQKVTEPRAVSRCTQEINGRVAREVKP